MHRSWLTAGLLVFLSGALTFSAVAAESDWPYWIGPRQDSSSPDLDLPAEWNLAGGEGSNLLWTAELWTAELGSRSTPVIQRNRLYLLTHSSSEPSRGTGEKVVCLDATTGALLWEQALRSISPETPNESIGWSSVTCDPVTGHVYAQGTRGDFCCLNGQTGELIWNKSLQEDFGLQPVQTGPGSSPLVQDGSVIVNGIMLGWGDQAKPNHRFLALDKQNGLPVWSEGTRPLPEQQISGVPVLGVVNGELQMVCNASDGGIHSLQPRTGKRLWSYYLPEQGQTSTPLIFAGRVYCGHSIEDGHGSRTGQIVCIDATNTGDVTSTATIWKKDGYPLRRSAPVLIEGRLYFVDDTGRLCCLNADTGDEIGAPVPLDKSLPSNLLSADGKLYVNSVNGAGHVLKPTPQGAESLFQFQFPEGEHCHGSPVAAGGRIYMATTGHLYCLAKPGARPEPQPLPRLERETHIALDEHPALVQPVPADIVMTPGTRLRYQIRLYNRIGQYLRSAHPDEVTFEVQGPGTVDNNGRYTITTEQQAPDVAQVAVTYRDFTGTARVRIIPALDWSFNFDDGRIPATWVSCAYRHAVIDADLLTTLRQADPLAGNLYVVMTSEFAKHGVKADFDNAAPHHRLRRLLGFLSSTEDTPLPKTVEDCREQFNPSLERLVQERVLASYVWNTAESEGATEPRLVVIQGNRGIAKNGVLCQAGMETGDSGSQSWLGPSHLRDYTIQSDIMIHSHSGKLPETGLIGQRYALNLLGNQKQLQLGTGSLQPAQASASVPFEAKPDVWYTLKLKVTAPGETAKVEGKIWLKGEPEPEAWSVTAEDAAPHQTGSPGLFGNVTDGELFYDHLTVTRNSAP
jgi:outer membrane protein assembly factor BamB